MTNCERVEFSCSEHDPGGYWMMLARFFVAEAHQGIWHVAEKRHAWRALALLCERIDAFAEEDERRFDERLMRRAEAAGIDTSQELVFVPLELYLEDDAT